MVFSVTEIPVDPFTDTAHPRYHAGFECLLKLLRKGGLSFYKMSLTAGESARRGLIAANDVVVIKINGQWKYRGATNSDLVRGIIQRVLDHPEGFTGEVVLVENGQGRGSLNCDVSGSGYPDGQVHANALNEQHSFRYLIEEVFKDPRVGGLLLDPYRETFISADDHTTDGYRKLENVSYPCFTTPRGNRVELGQGLWTGTGHAGNLKLINVPVLKTHAGSGITASLKHSYGLLSMEDGQRSSRHYQGLGEAVGKMAVSVRPAVLHVMDAVWVSHKALAGYPASSTFPARRIAASQDPLALDYWVSKHILFPIDENPDHDPDGPIVSAWMETAQAVINGRGGLFNPDQGVYVGPATRREEEMLILENRALDEVPMPPPIRRRRRTSSPSPGGAPAGA